MCNTREHLKTWFSEGNNVLNGQASKVFPMSADLFNHLLSRMLLYMVISSEAVSVTFDAATFTQVTVYLVRKWKQMLDFIASFEFVHIFAKNITQLFDHLSSRMLLYMVIGSEAVSVTFEAATFTQETVYSIDTWRRMPDFAASFEFVHIFAKDITRSQC